MLAFKKITLDDISILKLYLSDCDYDECDFAITTLYIWKDYYLFNYTYCICNNMLIIKSQSGNQISFLMPIGKNIYLKETLKILENYCENLNIKLTFSAVPKLGLDRLKNYYSNLTYNNYSDWFDYIYNILDLKNLRGKKYSNKRNHINKFITLYGSNYSYEPLSINNKDEVIQFLDNYKLKYEHDQMEFLEADNLHDILNNLSTFNVIGGILKINNKVVAFTIGDILNKQTLCVHVEKALKEVEGAYTMINYLFINHNYQNNLKFINREEDMGLENLRFSKENYHPIKYLTKYSVQVN